MSWIFDLILMTLRILWFLQQFLAAQEQLNILTSKKTKTPSDELQIQKLQAELQKIIHSGKVVSNSSVPLVRSVLMYLVVRIHVLYFTELLIFVFIHILHSVYAKYGKQLGFSHRCHFNQFFKSCEFHIKQSSNQ